MMHWELELLWPLVLTLFTLAAFALYVFVHNDRLYRLKLVLIPAVLLATLFSFSWFGARLGYAYPAGLPPAFEYVAHKLILVENRKAWLDVMVVSRKPLERDARLHRMPWSKPLEDALKKARQMQKGGGMIVMENKGKGDRYPQWMPRRVLPQDAVPKAPPDKAPVDLLAPTGPTV